MQAAAVRLFLDDSGQDLVEQALLAAVIGLAGLIVLDGLLRAMGVTYGSWEAGVDNLWDAPAPGGGS